jgi:hypothetical protein
VPLRIASTVSESVTLDAKKDNVENSPAVENLEYIDNPSSSPKEGTRSCVPSFVSVSFRHARHLLSDELLGSCPFASLPPYLRAVSCVIPTPPQRMHPAYTISQRRRRNMTGLNPSPRAAPQAFSSELAEGSAPTRQARSSECLRRHSV